MDPNTSFIVLRTTILSKRYYASIKRRLETRLQMHIMKSSRSYSKHTHPPIVCRLYSAIYRLDTRKKFGSWSNISNETYEPFGSLIRHKLRSLVVLLPNSCGFLSFVRLMYVSSIDAASLSLFLG